MTHTLSTRELEVTKLLVRGYLKKEIADKLRISVNTVRNHTTSIYEKLQVTSLGQLCWVWNNAGMNDNLFVSISAPVLFVNRRKTRQYA